MTTLSKVIGWFATYDIGIRACLMLATVHELHEADAVRIAKRLGCDRLNAKDLLRTLYVGGLIKNRLVDNPEGGPRIALWSLTFKTLEELNQLEQRQPMLIPPLKKKGDRKKRSAAPHAG